MQTCVCVDMAQNNSSYVREHQLGKISRLLKRGKSSKEHHKVPQEEARSSSSTNRKEEGNKSEGIRCKGNGTGGPEKVFRFKDEHDGEIRQVELTITSCSKHNLGRRATMVESLLGIVPSRFSSQGNSTTSSRVTHQGCQQQQQQTNATSATDRQSLHNVSLLLLLLFAPTFKSFTSSTIPRFSSHASSHSHVQMV